MQTWKLRLVSATSGGEVTLSQALLRYALSWFSLLFFGAGFLWAIFDRDRQFLHDRLAGTRIIFKEPPPPPGPPMAQGHFLRGGGKVLSPLHPPDHPRRHQ
jgi:uncharacterized RDD family membrane protein YckC